MGVYMKTGPLPSGPFALSFTGVTGANADLGLIRIEMPPHLYPLFN